MERFLRDMRSVSEEFRAKNIRGEARAVELSEQYNELKEEMRKKSSNPVSPRAGARPTIYITGCKTSPQLKKPCPNNKIRRRYNLTPQTKKRMVRSPERNSSNPRFTNMHKEDNGLQLMTSNFPNTMDNLLQN